jgi:hypothetical protein
LGKIKKQISMTESSDRLKKLVFTTVLDGLRGNGKGLAVSDTYRDSRWQYG